MLDANLEHVLSAASRPIRSILEATLSGDELSTSDALTLLAVVETDLAALLASADRQRALQAGEVVTYVVNRNINFTNVCVKVCKFCAFSRNVRSEQGYFLSEEEVVRRAVEAQSMGATEVCLQAGLVPTDKRGRLYVDLCRAIKRAAPELHLHAFSPEEVKFGAGLEGMPIREFLAELIAAGLDSLPGTSAEILDDEVRRRISPGRITTDEWVNVVTTAHELGLPTTSTMMFGHVEKAHHQVAHLELLRSIQRRTQGFTEFVPLAFVHAEAPLFARHDQAVQAGPSHDQVLRLYAVSRLMLGPAFRNVQVSWVKHGISVAKELLACGANDLGGTLINESISTSAGAEHGQLMRPSTLRAAIVEAGRVPAQRNTAYGILRCFGDESGQRNGRSASAASGLNGVKSACPDPLDAVTDPDTTFGSYDALVADGRFRFVRTSRATAERRVDTLELPQQTTAAPM